MFIKVDLDEPFIDGEGGQIWELTGGRSFIYGRPTAVSKQPQCHTGTPRLSSSTTLSAAAVAQQLDSKHRTSGRERLCSFRRERLTTLFRTEAKCSSCSWVRFPHGAPTTPCRYLPAMLLSGTASDTGSTNCSRSSTGAASSPQPTLIGATCWTRSGRTHWLAVNEQEVCRSAVQRGSRAHTGVVRISVRVRPGSTRPGVGGEHDGALVVRVRERAVDGRARRLPWPRWPPHSVSPSRGYADCRGIKPDEDCRHRRRRSGRPRPAAGVATGRGLAVLGSQTGSQRRQTLGHARQQPAIVSAARSPIRRRSATCSDAAYAPEKRKVGGSIRP
jgi:hypothetical protein